MHKTIIENATLEQLKRFSLYALSEIEKVDKDLYNDLEYCLYKEVFGAHFNEWLLEKATAKMMNEDGTVGPHWKVNETTMFARNHDVNFKRYNEYDFNYVINMLYSDFYGAVPNETSTYIKMARKFLEDKDADDGKALKYYWSMK